jgi:hypothetical protein
VRSIFVPLLARVERNAAPSTECFEAKDVPLIVRGLS